MVSASSSRSWWSEFTDSQIRVLGVGGGATLENLLHDLGAIEVGNPEALGSLLQLGDLLEIFLAEDLLHL